MKIEEQAIFIGLFGIFLYVTIGPYVFSLIDKVEILKNNFIHSLLFFTTIKGILILLAILSPLLLYLNYYIMNAIRDKNDARKSRKEEMQRRKEYIADLLKKDIEKFSLVEVSRFVDSVECMLQVIKRTRLAHFKADLLSRLKEAQKLQVIRKKEDTIKELDYTITDRREDVRVLDKEIHKKAREVFAEKRHIWRDLDNQDTSVFYRDEITDEDEYNILLENGYTQVNEYDIDYRQVMTVLVNPPNNHSPTHEFVVWSVKKVVQKIKKAERIETHKTRDADITFRYKDRNYAIEVETGTLLDKPKQLKAKMLSLQRKYGSNWFIVVTNKELVSKFNKWGPTTQRTGVEEMLKKMLEIE